MNAQYDIEYCLMREAVERAACDAATDIAVKSAHLRLADRYADRAWSDREARCAENDC